METIAFDGTEIALIVRGKTGVDHEPDLLAQHADVILADGTPIGFFGEGQGTTVVEAVVVLVWMVLFTTIGCFRCIIHIMYIWITPKNTKSSPQF